MGRQRSLENQYGGDKFRFRFEAGVAYRLNEGMRGHDYDVRRDWRVIVNRLNELVVIAGTIHASIPRESVVHVDYTNELPPNGHPGECLSAETLWIVPSLANLVSIEIWPPTQGHYGTGEWSIRRVVVSLREPDRFIDAVKPAGQGEVTKRGEDEPGDAEFDVPLAPEESADELCLAFFRKALEALKRLADVRGVPKVQIPHVVFSTPVPSHVCKEVSDYNRLIAAAQSVGQLRMPELHRCIDRLLLDGTLQVQHVDDQGNEVPPPPGFNPTPRFEQPFATVLLAMLRRWETFDLTDEQIQEGFQFFIRAWIEQSWDWDVTIPLLRFDSDAEDSIQPSDIQLSIEPFAPGRKEALWNMASFPDTMELADFRSFSGARFALAGVEVRHPETAPLHSEVIQDAADFITSLRLHQAGDVGASGVFSKARGAFEFRSSVAAMQDWFGVRRRGDVAYMQAAETIDRPAQIFHSLRSLSPQQRRDLDVALRWFNQSYRRDQPEDRIVDLTIALESTLLHGVEDELRFRAAVRGVAILARARLLTVSDDRIRVRDTLMALYDARSKIVHEGASLHAL